MCLPLAVFILTCQDLKGLWPAERLKRADDAGYVLETVDYGQAFRQLTAESDSEITEAVLDYVSGRFRGVRVMPRHELDKSPHWSEI